MGNGPANKYYQAGAYAALYDHQIGGKTSNPYAAWHEGNYPWMRGYAEWKSGEPEIETKCPCCGK